MKSLVVINACVRRADSRNMGYTSIELAKKW